MNNKIEIIISVVSQGLRIPFESKKGISWEKKVVDLRTELGFFDKTNQENCVLMLTNITEGYLLTLLKRLEGERGGDHIGAWILIPADINIKGTEIENVIDKVKKAISNPNKRDEQTLKELTEKEYGVLSVKKSVFESSGDKYAFREYDKKIGGEKSLREILDGLNQKYYKDYKRIFLLNNENNVSGFRYADECTNLTNETIYKSVILPPPDKNKCNSFTPYINDKIFDSPLCFTEKEKIIIEWKRGGFKTILKQVEIKENIDVKCPEENEWWVVFYYKKIEAYNEKGEKVKITTQPKEDHQTRENCYLLKYNKNEEWKVEVQADGYEPQSKILRLQNLREGYKVTLKEVVNEYELKIPNQQDKKEKFSIPYKTQHKLEKSPIEGYKIDKKVSLKYNFFSKKVLVIILVVFVFGLLLGGVIGWCLKPDSKESDPVKQDICTELDNELYWTKSFFGKHQGYENLWEHLNKGEIDSVLSYKDVLKQSEKFREIVRLFENMQQEKIDKPFGTMYCEDTMIDVDSYIDKIEQIIESKKDKIDQSYLSYLDKHEVWEKNEMEGYEELKGLWDALNKGDFSKIETFEFKLGSSAKFKEVLKVIKELQEKNMDKYKKPFKNATYNENPNDFKITINKYIKHINGIVQPTQNNNKSQETKSASQKGKTPPTQDEFNN